MRILILEKKLIWENITFGSIRSTVYVNGVEGDILPSVCLIKFAHFSKSFIGKPMRFNTSQRNIDKQLKLVHKNWEIHKYLFIEVIHFGLSKLNTNYKICINGFCILHLSTKYATELSECGFHIHIWQNRHTGMLFLWTGINWLHFQQW